MLLIAMGWDEENTPFFITNDGPITPEDDAWNDASLKDYLVKHGDLLSYSKESDDEYRIESELIATVEESANEQLPRIDAGENQAPPEDIGGLEAYRRHLEAMANAKHPGNEAAREALGEDFTPTMFKVEVLNEEARDLFDDDSKGMDIGFGGSEEKDMTTNDFMDVDAEGYIPFEFEWMAKEHDLKITDANHGLNEPGTDARRSIFSLTASHQAENSRSEVLSSPQRTMRGPRSVAIDGIAKQFC
jgi:hypothetical protein